MNPDGSEQVRLTQDLGSDMQAVWSPTGERFFSSPIATASETFT